MVSLHVFLISLKHKEREHEKKSYKRGYSSYYRKRKCCFIRLQFTDFLGTIKNVEIPISQLEKALDNKMMFDGSSIEGYVRIEESDMYLYPDL